MTRRTHPIDRLLSYACPVLLATCAPTRPPDRSSVVSPEPTDAVVKQIDHVMIATNERDRLEALLSDTLGLPVAWPAPGSARSSNTFVGLALGDVILELAPRRRTSPTEPGNFAFQPIDLRTALDHLGKRGLVPLAPATELNDAGEKRWTTIGFRHGFQGMTIQASLDSVTIVTYLEFFLHGLQLNRCGRVT